MGNISDCNSLKRMSHFIPVLASPAMVASTRIQIRMYSARSFNRLPTSDLALWCPVTLAFYGFPVSRLSSNFEQCRMQTRCRRSKLFSASQKRSIAGRQKPRSR